MLFIACFGAIFKTCMYVLQQVAAPIHRGSLAPPPSQRLRRVHQATTARLFPQYDVHIHIVLLHSWNGEHVIPWCIFQYTIPLVCVRGLFFLVLPDKNPSWVNLPNLRSDPRFASVWSFGAILMLWPCHMVRVEKEFGWASLLSLSAKAQSQVLGLIWLHYFFLLPHAIPSIEVRV